MNFDHRLCLSNHYLNGSSIVKMTDRRPQEIVKEVNIQAHIGCPETKTKCQTK